MLGNVEKYDNVISYERKIREMGRSKRKTKVTTSERQKTEHTSSSEKGKSGFLKSIKKTIKNNTAAFVVAVVGGVLVLVIWSNFHDLPKSIEELKANDLVINTRLDSLQSNYEILSSHVWSLNKASIDEEDEPQEEAVILLAAENVSGGMLRAKPPEEDKTDFLGGMESIKGDDVIGKNAKTQKEETKKDMENRAFVTHYEEDGEDVFFYGKYNDNGQWDGKCIINRYKNSKLTFIMEGEYENGNLIKYEQVFKGKNSSEQKVWYVSKRISEGIKNSGETTTYFFYGDYEENFEIKTIKEEDILSVEKFLETIPSTMEGYYSGYTSDGEYNDDSGNAYLVKYDSKGNVRYLYKGKIKNGEAHDNSGNAWVLSWGHANDGYHYHKGVFENGSPKNTKKDWNYPVDQDFINSVVNPDEFNCPLTGLIK